MLLPWCHVQDVSLQLQTILKEEGEQQEDIVHIDTNDIGQKRIEIQHKESAKGSKAGPHG